MHTSEKKIFSYQFQSLSETPITINEFNRTVKGMNTGEPPGPDGYTLSNYKALQDTLA